MKGSRPPMGTELACATMFRIRYIRFYDKRYMKNGRKYYMISAFIRYYLAVSNIKGMQDCIEGRRGRYKPYQDVFQLVCAGNEC